MFFPHDNEKYPWALNTTGSVVMFFRLIFRPDLLIYEFVLPNRLVISWILITPLLVNMLLMMGTMSRIVDMTDLNFIKMKANSKLFLVLSWTSSLFFKVLLIPSLANSAL
jgi:hypothetical protein